MKFCQGRAKERPGLREPPRPDWHYEKIDELEARITINRETGNRVMAHVQTLRMEAMKLWEFVE